jgi:hypothetical protein
MPLCNDEYETKEIYIPGKDILLRKRLCTIYMLDEGEKILHGGPSLIWYELSQRNLNTLKNAYIRRGNVRIGMFTSDSKEGIYVEEIPLPNPFRWKMEWPSLDKLVEEDVEKKIEEEFGIDIKQYLHNTL